MENAVVVGAGTMGAGIAYSMLSRGMTVHLVEPSAEQAKAARAVIVRRLVDAAAGTGPEALTVLASLDDAPPRPDVIVEAVPERLPLKASVLASAEALDPGLLASNTSSLSIDSLGDSLSQPGRFLGLHFFNPVWSMPLVEIVRGGRTSESAVAGALALVDALGKEAIVVGDSPGFATSRLGVALGLEAIRMLEEGVASPEDIDKAMVLGYRYPMGPLRLGDLVGLDVRLDIARALHAELGPRFEPPALLVRMVQEGKLGKKTGQGFYEWAPRQ